ncbi:MAG: WS/DGAT/MGAT family O-acyltransferase [Acidimicrobiales bacterium]
MERLSGMDATFLYIENASHHMHVSMVSVFDPSEMPGGYSFAKIRAVVNERIPRIQMFRRRLVTVPFNLGHPIWVEDPDLDLDYHLRRVAVPAPGGIKELTELASAFVSRQLDRSRPMWEMQVVEGLEGGNIGVLAKVHHSMVDGVGGADMMVHLFDLEPNPAPSETVEELPPKERVPSDWELVSHALLSTARRPAKFLGLIPGTIKAVTGVARARRASTGPNMPAPFSAPATPFNAAITPHRSIAVTRLSLSEVKEVKRAFGCTVNDVVLALCGGALRRYLDRIGQLPDKPLVAVVPVSVRAEADIEGSNAVSAMFTTLATDIADPEKRIAAIHDTTLGAKEEHKAIGADLLTNWAEFAAPVVFTQASRLYSSMKLADRHRPIHNVIISNVPGPPFPLYLAGAKLVMLCPLGPVMEGAGLNITVLSHMDSIDVGLIACSELIPDLWDMARDFDESMEELKAAAGAN